MDHTASLRVAVDMNPPLRLNSDSGVIRPQRSFCQVDELRPFSHVILALVGDGGAGPHDLIRMMRQGRVYWSAADSHYYAEPKRLEKLGYLASEKRPGRTHDRTHYMLTEKGRGALREMGWGADAVSANPAEAVVKVLAGDIVGRRRSSRGSPGSGRSCRPLHRPRCRRRGGEVTPPPGGLSPAGAPRWVASSSASTPVGGRGGARADDLGRLDRRLRPDSIFSQFSRKCSAALLRGWLSWLSDTCVVPCSTPSSSYVSVW